MSFWVGHEVCVVGLGMEGKFQGDLRVRMRVGCNWLLMVGTEAGWGLGEDDGG